MTCGLFSIFDPHFSGSGMSGKLLLSLFLILPLLGSSVYPVKSWGLEILIQPLFESVAPALVKCRESFIILFSLFVFILFSGVQGMLPFSFAITSHLAVTLSISIPLWLSGVINSFFSNKDEWLAHLLPMGSPAPLWPFLVLIELTSFLIRPVTLAIRLMANVSAGHLTMSILFSSDFFLNLPPAMMGSFYISFELGISTVQAFVFMSLLSLYWAE